MSLSKFQTLLSISPAAIGTRAAGGQWLNGSAHVSALLIERHPDGRMAVELPNGDHITLAGIFIANHTLAPHGVWTSILAAYANASNDPQPAP